MKKYAYILVCAVMAVSMAGCTNSADNGGNNSQTQSENNGQSGQKENNGSAMGQGELDAEAVSEYFPQDNKYHIYNGYAEAGFETKFVGIENDDDGMEYKYVGAMNDERGMIDEKVRVFEVTYTVGGGKVTESVDNEDYMAESEDRLYSKIEDMVILSGAIEEGSSWEQPVEIDGVKTTLKTTITKVGEDSFTTVSEAEAEGYKNGKYTEERTYTKGQGLTSFSNTPYGSDKDDTLIFGYGFSMDSDVSITGMI